MKVMIDDALWGEFASQELLIAALARCGKKMADVRIELRKDEARHLSSAHIDHYYPLYRQLNIMRAGLPPDIDRMGRFIDAVRAWSNGEAPAPSALEAILP